MQVSALLMADFHFESLTDDHATTTSQIAGDSNPNCH
jgi:hypothetical protein